MSANELHVEHLLGRRVVDVDGRSVGRLEELHAELVDGELVVTEFHIGTGAFVERIAGFLRQMPFLRALPRAGREFRVRWRDIDLADPSRPVVRLRRHELREAPLEEHR